MGRNSDLAWLLGGALLMMAFSCAMGWVVGRQTTQQKLQTEAVSRGYAVWNTSDSGISTFAWKDENESDIGSDAEASQ